MEGLYIVGGDESEGEGKSHRWYHQWPGQSSASCRPGKTCTVAQANQRLPLVPGTKATKLINAG